MKKIVIVLLTIMLVFPLTSCAKEDTAKSYNSVEQIDGSIIGVLNGTVFDDVASKSFPNSEIRYYNNNGDIIQALKEHRIDAHITDDIQAIQLCKEEEELAFFNNSLQNYDYAFAFAKTDNGKALRDDFNIFLNEIIRDGTVEEIINKWSNDTTATIDFSSLTPINGTLTMATDSTSHPMSFNIDGNFAGIDIEIAYLYCLSHGYGLQIEDYAFENIIPSIASGKVDFAGAGIMVTNERTENVYFSNSYYNSGSFVIVLKERYEKEPETADDFAGKKIGVLANGIGISVVNNTIKNPTIIELEGASDMLTALRNGKIDALVQTETTIKGIISEDPAVKIVCPVYVENWGFMFKKSEQSDALRQQMNEFIIQKKANGELEELYNKWSNNEIIQVDYDSLTGENGTLEVAICSAIGQPNCYYASGKLVGYDIDLYTQFARQYGYKLNFSDYAFAATITAVTSGKADIGGITVAITDERKESVNFSESYMSCYIDIAYYDSNYSEEETSFIDSIIESFQKTFIREDRYKLFIDGIISTSFITLVAIIFGSLLGLLTFLLSRRNNAFINSILKIYAWLINGMPTVVLLMIFFYVIFTDEIFTSTMVAIFTFIIIFSVTVFGLLKSSFATVDKGQYDAAYALGYSKKETFFKIIVPQVAPHFLPTYSSEIVSLLKSTSVVGYIAVQDLTKMSDIIRSRTYESFFPLIATTIMYFIIATIFTSIVSFLMKKIDPRQRDEKDIFKGVQRHD